MKKAMLATLVAAVLFGFSALASAEVDHWAASDQCSMAQGAPYYYPTIVKEQSLAKNEVARGFPTPSCVEMRLPDRLGGRGWVRIGEDRKIIFDRNTGKALRLAECNNQIYAVVALPLPVGEQGKQGNLGPQGTPGKNCTVKENDDGTKTITCAETSVLVENGEKGDKGDPGVGCTSRDNGDGTKSIICGDRTSVLVSDGKPGPPGPQGTPAPLSWSQEHPWLYGAAWVTAGVVAFFVCRNNCAHWLGLEAAAAAPAGVPPRAFANPTGVGPGAFANPTTVLIHP